MNNSRYILLQKVFPDAMQYVQDLVKSGIMHHAYVISSIADGPQEAFVQYWASLLVCATNDACGSCQQCVSLNRSIHADVHLLQKEDSSSISVERARAFQHHLVSAPQIAPQRIGLLYSVDALTTSAANALLKSIEEPHDHALLLMTTSHKQRIIGTIRSRTHVIDLPRISDDIVRQTVKDEVAVEWIDGRYQRLQSSLEDSHDAAWEQWKEQQVFWNDLLADDLSKRTNALQKWLQSKPGQAEVTDALNHIERSVRTKFFAAIEQNSQEQSILHRKLQLLQESRTVHQKNANPKILMEYIMTIL